MLYNSKNKLKNDFTVLENVEIEKLFEPNGPFFH